jgi:hypothetical protein
MLTADAEAILAAAGDSGPPPRGSLYATYLAEGVFTNDSDADLRHGNEIAIKEVAPAATTGSLITNSSESEKVFEGHTTSFQSDPIDLQNSAHLELPGLGYSQEALDNASDDHVDTDRLEHLDTSITATSAAVDDDNIGCLENLDTLPGLGDSQDVDSNSASVAGGHVHPEIEPGVGAKIEIDICSLDALPGLGDSQTVNCATTSPPRGLLCPSPLPSPGEEPLQRITDSQSQSPQVHEIFVPASIDPPVSIGPTAGQHHPSISSAPTQLTPCLVDKPEVPTHTVDSTTCVQTDSSEYRLSPVQANLADLIPTALRDIDIRSDVCTIGSLETSSIRDVQIFSESAVAVPPIGASTCHDDVDGWLESRSTAGVSLPFFQQKTSCIDEEVAVSINVDSEVFELREKSLVNEKWEDLSGHSSQLYDPESNDDVHTDRTSAHVNLNHDLVMKKAGQNSSARDNRGELSQNSAFAVSTLMNLMVSSESKNVNNEGGVVIGKFRPYFFFYISYYIFCYVLITIYVSN